MTDLMKLVEDHRYEDLFLDHLFWDEGDYRQLLAVHVQGDHGQDETFELENVAGYQGIRVFVCPSLPSKSVQASIATRIGQKATNYLLIFHDRGAHQIWRWPAPVLRAGKSSIKLTSHEHTRGLSNSKLEKRLEAIIIPQGETLSVTALLDKIQSAFETETEDETKKASQQMVDLFTALQQAGMSEAHISETLARLLFVMFGDDTAMWGEGRKNLFERYILDHTAEDGSDIADKLHELFVFLDTKPSKQGALAAEGKAEFAGFKYVNGGIFSDPQPLPEEVGQDFRDAILRASRRDWADISPAIFGSMFQSVRDANTRREMGEHYTSEKNILKTLNPLFLDDLRETFHSTRGKESEVKDLKTLRKRLARIKFMDPACGCGNFVIIAYRELRALETAIVARLIELGAIKASKAGFVMDVESTKSATARTLSIDPMVSIDNFYGIEIDPWPAAIARTAMFLTERQSDQLMAEKFGYAPVRLPLCQESHIVTADALRTDWNAVLPTGEKDEVYIAGNPPFIGQKEKTEDQIVAMKEVWGSKYDGYLDFVTGWFKKSIDYFEQNVTEGREFSFVSTNSITQGQPVSTLFDYIYDNGWDISFAYQPFPWDAEAAVHCVITGFTKAKGKAQRLFIYKWSEKENIEVPVSAQVNAYLQDGPKVLVRKRMNSKKFSADLSTIESGSKGVDWNEYTIADVEKLKEVQQDSIAAKYIRKYIGGDELINNGDRWCLWLAEADEDDIFASEVLKKRVESVRAQRLASKRAATLRAAATPHIFGENRQPQGNYLGIPQTFSENRKYATADRLDAQTIASIKLFTASDEDGFLFAVISSSMFITWQKAVGGRLESRPSFSNTIVWNNLPLPPVDAELRKKIIEAGKGVLKARERISEEAGETISLATMYKPDSMPEPLFLAHQELDKLVDVAFGAPAPLETNEERLQLLFKQYDAMIKAEEKATKAKPSRAKRPRRKTTAQSK